MDKKIELYQIITAAWNHLRTCSEKERLTDHDWEQFINEADAEIKAHSGAEFDFARKIFGAVSDYLEEIGKDNNGRS